METDKKIIDWVEDNERAIFSFIRQLVQTPSISGNEGAVQKIIQLKFKEIGLRIDIWEPDAEVLKDCPDWVSAFRDYADRPNVVGIQKGGGGGKSLIINGHVDVVPPGPEEAWTTEPWGGEVRGGHLYGRGAADMKGGLGSAIMALQGLKELDIRTGGDIIIESVVDEEKGGNGTLACCLRGYRADAAIIPEPTGLSVCPISRGSVWFKLLVPGKQAHSGSAYMGINAFERSCEIARELKEFEKERNEALRAREQLFSDHPLPIPLFIGMAKGGMAPNIVPESFLLDGILSIGPDETVEGAKKELEGRLNKFQRIHEELGISGPELSFSQIHFGPAKIPKDHFVVKALIAAMKTAKIEAKLKGFPSGCDVRHLIQYANTPGIVFGPGNLGDAHKPNECISLSEIKEFVKVMMIFMSNWCGKE